MTSPVGTTNYEYYSTSGRLKKITGPQNKEFEFFYSQGQLDSIQRPNGITTSYGFDNNGNLTNLDHWLSGDSIRHYAYTYDKNGMRDTMTDINGIHAFVYDSLYQITQATHPTSPTENFSYDAVGNWQGFGRVHNALNQLTEDSSFTYEYDADGNMTLKVDKSSNDCTMSKLI